MGVIDIRNLTRDYGKGRGIFDVSFEVTKSEVFGFLGPNGAGKTTTIRHLMGFLKPRSGRVSIAGLDCWRHSSEIQRTLGYIPGEISFFDDMTGIDYLRFLAKYRGLRSEKKMMDILARFELDPQAKLKKMSKGMRQKVGITAAFMHDPDVLILDEPTSGLDPLMQNRFIDFILEEKNRGKTILMSSHMFEEVERTCHRVGIIRDGKIAAIDSVDSLKAEQIKKYTVTLKTTEDAERFAKEGFAVSDLSQNHITVSVQNNMDVFIATMARYPVTNISAPSQSLEEVFLHYYGGDIHD